MSRPTITKWIAIAIVAVSALILVRMLPTDDLQQNFQNWIAGLGVWGGIVFVVIYIVATVCMIPGSLITLVGGAIFGLGLGFVLVSVASTTGAALAFLIARYVARAKVAEMAASNEKFAAVDEAISEGGWKIVGLLRLSPAIPFNWQNYLYGLTRIAFWPYVLTSWIAMMPGTLMYVYLGTVAGAASTGAKKSAWQWGLLIVGLLATIIVTVYITHLARQKLNAKTKPRSTVTSNSTK